MSPNYFYEAKNREGNAVTGNISAENTSEVAHQLREQGYYVTSVEKAAEERKGINLELPFKKGIKLEELAVFSQQFSVLINAGIPLVESLETVRKQTDNKRMAEVIQEILGDIETGKSLSEAMMRHPRVFPDFYCQLVKAGEAGGILDNVLQKLTEHYQRQNEIQQEIKSTLYYPVVIMIVAFVSIIFLITSVVPKIVKIFIDFNSQLPLPTRILLWTSGFMQEYWWLVAAILILVIISLVSYFRSSHGRRVFGKFILKIPVAGSLVRKVAISRFSSTLGILLSSGVNLLSALPIVEEVVNNSVIADCIMEARNRLREGINISEPLEESGQFPPMVIQMMKIGEESGELDDMLIKVSEFYDHEVETSIEGTISLIEPILIVGLALVIGFIAISIIMPLFDMYTFIG